MIDLSHHEFSPSASTYTTVLLIEDDPDHLEFWSRALRNCSSNYSVLEASDGQEALKLLSYQRVDCVVLDLDLPDSSGFQFLFDLIPDLGRPQVAVIILTDLSYLSLEELALHNGAQAYLVKLRTSADALDKAIQKAVTSVASARSESLSKECG